MEAIQMNKLNHVHEGDKPFQKTNIVDPSLHTPRNNSHGINLGSNPKKELELSKTPSYYLQMHLANFCSVFKQTLPPLRPRVYIMRKYTQQASNLKQIFWGSL